MELELFFGPIPKKIKIVFLDFDGTLKPSGKPVSKADIKAMAELRRQGIIRVVATGRGLYSFQRDKPEDLGLDYLIFSSGLGLCKWKKKGPGPLLLAKRFTEDERDRALKACLKLERGFFAFEPPPYCHRHVYVYPKGRPFTEGFLKRLRSYCMFAKYYDPCRELGERAEFLIAAPTAEMPEVKESFQALCPDLSILYSSSPFGDDSMWLEIFPPGVNKSQAAKVLVENLSLEPENALAMGNDFNDYDLLTWAEIGLVTSNSPKELRNIFPNAPDVTHRPLAWLTNLFPKRTNRPPAKRSTKFLNLA
jgi:hydroxymethylpyrimidine pyrophosphatase-like HAD family hydrolase